MATIAPSSGNTDNRREQAHQTCFPDRIANFALGVGSVKKQHVVVDIHAGDQGISPKLNRIGAKVIAIDQRGALALKPNGGPGEGRRVNTGSDASGLTLPVEPRSVDIVFVDLVLGHIQTPALAIAEIKRILKPGGRLVITDIEKFSDAESQEANKERWMGFYPGDIRHWLKTAGFSNIIVNPVPTRQYGGVSARLGYEMPVGYLMATGTA
jgi:SAM-dependent methyltransferase